MLLPGRTVLLLSALACAACGTRASRRPLLSAARLALVEGQTAKVYADVASVGDLSITPPPGVTIMKLTDASGPGFAVTPGCDAAPGHDVTANVEVHASDGRAETLVLAITNNATIDCFVHAELEMSPPFACADLDGSGALTVVGSGTTELVTLDPALQPASSRPYQGAVPPMKQLLAVPTASQGIAIYAVDDPSQDKGALWLLEPGGPTTKPAWKQTPLTVGSDVVPLRSDPSLTVPDYLVGRIPGSATSVQLTKLDLSKPTTFDVALTDVDVGTMGGTFGIGTWSSGLGLAAVVANVPDLGPMNPNLVLPYDLTWNADGTVSVNEHAPGIPNDFTPGIVAGNPIAITIAERRAPSGHDDLVANIVTGQFDDAIGEIAINPVMNQPSMELRTYGGVRSIASAPDGSVLLASDSGALRTRYAADAVVDEPIDLLAQEEPDLPIDYGDGIAPCLAADGSLVGYVVATDLGKARVALLPGSR